MEFSFATGLGNLVLNHVNYDFNVLSVPLILLGVFSIAVLFFSKLMLVHKLHTNRQGKV